MIRVEKPAILRALPPGRHAVIEASAGTGKTYTLEHLVIDLLLTQKLDLDQILVVTFTEKATAELCERVRKKLATLLAAEETAPPEIPDESCWLLDEDARARLRQAISDFDRASISTIHAFCQRILTEHAFASGRLLGEQPIDERSAFEAAFRDLLRRRLARDLELLPFLDAWLRWQDPDVDKLATFLFQCHVKHSPIDPTVDPARLRALAHNFPTDEKAFLAECGIELRAAVAQLFLPLLREHMATEKRDQGRFDFQDMLELVAARLAGPDGTGLTALLRARYQVALIDEFQDTDRVQWSIFRKLFFEAGSGSLYLIGDPKQAIYGFRGADVQTYLDAKREVLDAGGVVVPLTESFRSTAPLVSACNAIFDQAAAAPFFTGEIHYDHPVTCGVPARTATLPDGRLAAPVVVYRVETEKSLRASGPFRDALGRRMAEEIRALLGGALLIDAGDGRPRRLAHREIFVLTRTGGEAEQAGEHLRRACVRFAFYKQDGLYQSAEAEDVRDLLAAIAAPHDPSRRCKAWLTPFFGIGLGELDGARDLPESHPLYARLLAWRALADDEAWATLFGRVLDDSGILTRALYRGGSERPLTNYLHLFELLLEEANERRACLDELSTRFSALVGGRAQPDGVDGNLQRLESERDAVQVMTMHMAKGLQAEAVFLYGGLSRWHDALRPYHLDGARRIFLGTKDTADYPKDPIKKEELEEDQRLLYVALTRARSRLYLPFFPKNSYSAVASSPYGQLNAQLARAHERPELSWEPVPIAQGGSLEVAPPARPPLEGFRPSGDFAGEPDSAHFAALKRAHAGFQITSYTRMAHAHATTTGEPAAGEFTGERGETTRPVREGELPGGAATGIFLHELLERIDLASFAAASFDAWRVRPEVRALLDETMRRHDRDPRHLTHVERLIFAAYTAPIRLGDAPLSRGLAGAAHVRREVEFLYPWPERSHPRLGAPHDRSPLTIERGFVKGYVDLVFEHQGRALFADWKSDLLPDFSPARLAAQVGEHYLIQARLYALALVKLLGVRDEADYQARFGGLLFCFLRGMAPDSDASVHFERPRFSELQSWEERLARGLPLDGDAP